MDSHRVRAHLQTAASLVNQPGRPRRKCGFVVGRAMKAEQPRALWQKHLSQKNASSHRGMWVGPVLEGMVGHELTHGKRLAKAETLGCGLTHD